MTAPTTRSALFDRPLSEVCRMFESNADAVSGLVPDTFTPSFPLVISSQLIKAQYQTHKTTLRKRLAKIGRSELESLRPLLHSSVFEILMSTPAVSTRYLGMALDCAWTAAGVLANAWGTRDSRRSYPTEGGSRTWQSVRSRLSFKSLMVLHRVLFGEQEELPVFEHGKLDGVLAALNCLTSPSTTTLKAGRFSEMLLSPGSKNRKTIAAHFSRRYLPLREQLFDSELGWATVFGRSYSNNSRL